jgi:hypothetical protein
MGIKRAWLLVREFFGGRALRHRKAVGALSGLTPPPCAWPHRRRAGHRHRRQRAQPRDGHRDGLGLAALAASARAAPVVSAALGAWEEPLTPERDGRPGAHAAHGLVAVGRDRGRAGRRGPASGGTARTPSRACGETALAWAAREETGGALRPDLEKGLSPLALARCQKRMQDQVVGVQRPTRREGRLRQRRLTHSSAPSTGRSGEV